MAKTSIQPAMAKHSKQEHNKTIFTATIIALVTLAVTVTIFILLLVSGVLQWRTFAWYDWILILLIPALLGFFLHIGYTAWYGWTGFGDYTSPVHDEQTEFQRGKTLWDWLQLLIIPIMLAAGTLWFTQHQNEISIQLSNAQHVQDQLLANQQHESDQQIAKDQQQYMLLEGYLDHMSDLLLTDKLRQSKPMDEVRQLATARTLAALPSLDPRRKGILIRFLYAAGLINRNDPIISLNLADLSQIKLEGAQLSNGNLSGANLSNADLSGANLSNSDLSNADFSSATLINAQLNNTLLRDAILSQANLNGANLSNADLSSAQLDQASLDDASLSYATLNDTNLYQATLSAANLSYAMLFIANLGYAQLDYAILRHTNLGHADLNHAILRYANLSDADLNYADLNHADLYHTTLRGALLSHADISGATGINGQLATAKSIFGIIRK